MNEDLLQLTVQVSVGSIKATGLLIAPNLVLTVDYIFEDYTSTSDIDVRVTRANQRRAARLLDLDQHRNLALLRLYQPFEAAPKLSLWSGPIPPHQPVRFIAYQELDEYPMWFSGSTVGTTTAPSGQRLLQLSLEAKLDGGAAGAPVELSGMVAAVITQARRDKSTAFAVELASLSGTRIGTYLETLYEHATKSGSVTGAAQGTGTSEVSPPPPNRSSPATPSPDRSLLDALSPDTPLPVTPAPNTPVLDTPMLDTPVLDTPVLDTPVLDTPAPDEPSAQDTSLGGTPADPHWVNAASRFPREVTAAEQGLGVDQYAMALAEALDDSDGAACFAIFGHWGRGKTHLGRRVVYALSHAELQHRYEAVWFSAWKFPTAPEVWAHLYETFARTAYDHDIVRSIPRAIRAKLSRSGVLPIIGYLALASIGLLPLGFWIQLVWATIGWLSIVGLFACYRLYRTFRGPIAKLVTQSIFPVRHHEKLGLQASVGIDLQALIRGWLFKPSLPWASILLFWASVSAFGGGLWICLRSVLEVPSLMLVVGTWLVLVAVVTGWIYHAGLKSDRILLIVDDLDRCEPEHLIRVIESIRIHIEEPGLEDRVQVLALVEEDVFRWAIRNKYRLLSEEEGFQNRIEQDTLEKLFVAHLRLPPLRRQDLEEAMELFLHKGRAPKASEDRLGNGEAWVRSERHPAQNEPGRPVPPPAQSEQRSPPTSTHAGPESARTEAASSRLEPRRRVDPPVAARPRSELVFSDDEKRVLQGLIPIIMQHRPGSIGPRTMKSFLFRYQLARLLLRHRGHRITPEHLAHALAHRLVHTAPTAPHFTTNDQDLQAVLDEVA